MNISSLLSLHQVHPVRTGSKSALRSVLYCSFSVNTTMGENWGKCNCHVFSVLREIKEERLVQILIVVFVSKSYSFCVFIGSGHRSRLGPSFIGKISGLTANPDSEIRIQDPDLPEVGFRAE